MTVRLAFATISGAEVDVHFGGASRFDVYDVDQYDALRVGARMVSAYRSGQSHSVLPDAIADCTAVFVAQVGQGAVAALSRAGKRVFVAPGRIDAIIAQLQAGDLLASLEAGNATG